MTPYLASLDPDIRHVALAAWRSLRIRADGPHRLDVEQLGADLEYWTWRALETYDPSHGAKLTTHVTHTIKHRMLDTLRALVPGLRPKPETRDKRPPITYQAFSSEMTEWWEEQADPCDLTESVVSRVHAAQVASAALSGLSARHREALCRYVDGENCRQIGKALGVGDNRAWQLVDEARRQARAKLGACDAHP